MPTQFIDNLVNGDVIDASHVDQYGVPIQNVESGSTWYQVATGSPNAYVVTFPASNVITAYTQGLIVHFKASPGANTGASTLKVNSLAAVTLVRPDGSALQAGDIPSGAIMHSQLPPPKLSLVQAAPAVSRRPRGLASPLAGALSP